MVSVTDKPKAATMYFDSLKPIITPQQANISIQLMAGIYICPFISEGNITLSFGHKLRRIASATSVYEPLISAWLAMIVANVAMIMDRN